MLNSHLSEIFSDYASKEKMEDEEIKELSGRLKGVENELDSAASKVREELKISDYKISDGDKKEILRKALDNLGKGVSFL